MKSKMKIASSPHQHRALPPDAKEDANNRQNRGQNDDLQIPALVTRTSPDRTSAPAMDTSTRPGNELQWVNVTNPLQPTDKRTMRNVRAHVMYNYIKKENKYPSDKGKRARKDESAKRQRHTDSSSDVHMCVKSSAESSLPSPDGNQDHGLPLASSRSRNGASHIEPPSQVTDMLPDCSGASQMKCSRFDNLISLAPSDATKMTDLLILPTFSGRRGLSGRGIQADDFQVEPRFKDPQINMESLRHSCTLGCSQSLLENVLTSTPRQRLLREWTCKATMVSDDEHD